MPDGRPPRRRHCLGPLPLHGCTVHCRPVEEEASLLKFFQEQRLEHTRLLRREIERLEQLERVYLTTIKQVLLAFSLKVLLFTSH